MRRIVDQGDVRRQQPVCAESQLLAKQTSQRTRTLQRMGKQISIQQLAQPTRPSIKHARTERNWAIKCAGARTLMMMNVLATLCRNNMHRVRVVVVVVCVVLFVLGSMCKCAERVRFVCALPLDAAPNTRHPYESTFGMLQRSLAIAGQLYFDEMSTHAVFIACSSRVCG